MLLSRTSLNAPVRDHLRRDFIRLRPDWTVGEATAWLREHPSPGKIAYFYVVDDAGRLHGVATARALLTSPADRLLAEVMIPGVETLPATATVREACDQLQRRRLLALPVVDGDGALLGVVDVELYTDEIRRLDDPAGATTCSSRSASTRPMRRRARPGGRSGSASRGWAATWRPACWRPSCRAASRTCFIPG